MLTDSPVYVDAWFDWDQDGQFEASERERYGTVGTGLTQLFNNLTTTVQINVPPSALSGQTYARFRLSESPFTGPTGNAISGEVEDYAIFVSSNPYQNASNRFDANASNAVTPLDALQIINALARNAGATGSVDLQTTPITTPRYPDVNGDGNMTASDALAVINELARTQGLGEGEQTFVPAAPGVLASGSTAVGDLLIHETMLAPVTVSADSATETEDAPVVEVVETAEKTSVFDSPATIELDSIVDQLAEDASHAGSDTGEEENGLDQFFASL